MCKDQLVLPPLPEQTLMLCSVGLLELSDAALERASKRAGARLVVLESPVHFRDSALTLSQLLERVLELVLQHEEQAPRLTAPGWPPPPLRVPRRRRRLGII